MIHSSRDNSNNMGSRTRKQTYMCSSCDKSFSTQTVLTEHKQTHKGGIYSCYQCGEVTTTLTKMVIHKRMHTTEDQILSLGETDHVLDFKYNNISSRKFETKIYPVNMDPHTTVKQEMDLTGGKFDYNDYIRIEDHNTVEVDIKEEVYSNNRYQCSQCDKYFSQNDDLIMHQKIHTGEQPYQCSLFEKSLVQTSEMLKHNSTINGVKPIQLENNINEIDSIHTIANLELRQTVKQEMATSYQCNQCDNYFSRKDDLIIHQKIHTGELLYQCSLFEKCLALKSNMLNDSTTTNGEKPYQCKLCDHYVVRKQDLVTHQKIHTGELYQCIHCGKCFAQKCEMLTHRMIHIVENETMDIHCRVCGTEAFGDSKPLETKQQRILAWMYQLLDFDAERTETQVICRICSSSFNRFKRTKQYNYRSYYKHPKSPISIVVWDSDSRCPVYQRNGVPYRYSVEKPRNPWLIMYPKRVNKTASDNLSPKITPCNLCKNII